MRGLLLLFIFLPSVLCIASAEIRVSGADATYNATLLKANVTTEAQPVTDIFTFNDNGKANQSMEAVKIPTIPAPLTKIFILHEAASNIWPLEKGIVPTSPISLNQIFVLHEFVKDQKDLAYPISLLNDSTPPIISDVAFDNVNASNARINWTTDEFADSLVKFGISPGDYAMSKGDDLYAKNHSISLSDLSPGTRYYFVVNGTDRSGNSAQSAAFDFETLKI
jgi:hypothetical protein